MNVVVIGSGWLAQPLAKHIMGRGHSVCLTSIQAAKAKELTAHGLPCVTYQLGAAILPKPITDAQVVILTTTCKDVTAHQQLMDQLDPDVAVLFVSSTSVYANDGGTHKETSSRLNHDSPLLAIEGLIRKRPRHAVMRLSGLVGPERHPGRFGRAGRTLKNPNAPVNVVHLDDVINALSQIIDLEAWGQVFHLAALKHPSKVAFYSAMAAQLNAPVPQFGESNRASDKCIDATWSLNTLDLELKYPDPMTMDFT